MSSAKMILLIVFVSAYMARIVDAQCPWNKELTDLHSDCICAYNNKIQKLSIQCTAINFARLMVTLRESLKEIAIDLLYVNNATLDGIPDSSFRGLDIEDLHISKCKLKTISENAFDGLEDKLHRLSLQDNFIGEVPVAAINKLRSLKVLDLSNNLLSEIPDDSFRQTQLSTLKLGDNQLIRVAQFAFRGLETHLKNLNLKNTSLSNIPSAVQNLSSLAFLDLSHNTIRELQPFFMRNLQTLTALSLERNRIEFINETAFVGVNGSLSSLSLLSNSFTRFPIEAISQLKELRVLDLGFNGIQELPEHTFRENTFLTLLALDGNPISTLKLGTFEHLNATLRGLRIGGKALVCDCNLRWISEWIKNYSLQVTSRERYPQFCGKPDNLRRKNFWQMSFNDFVCENQTVTEKSAEPTTKEPKKLSELVEPKAREEKRLNDNEKLVTADSYETTVSTVTELRFPIHSLALTSKPSIDWESTISETLGFEVIFRYFGHKEYKKAATLNANQRKHTVNNLPSAECIIVCIRTVRESQSNKLEDLPSNRCREVRSDRQRVLDLEKIVIAATVVVCAFVLVAVIVFSCCYRSDKKKSLPSLPPPLAPSMKADNEWETVSMYSTRSIPRARMYHMDANMNGGHTVPLDETRSHVSHYSHVATSLGKHRSQQSPKAYSQLSSRFSHQNGTLQHHKSNPNISGAQSFLGNHLNSSKKKASKNNNHCHRLNSTSSLHSLTEYDSDPWNSAAIIEPKLSNWKDNEVDIYVGQNHVVPTHRHFARR
ncbi:uncharacterized protein B4U80_05627 [Leptotrombidium deliense]|uniref:Disease resistance R13L4/SHOC-2-like LRR domain-containing protein n=1 Tax=Leptotrombidium deliense TaxID=299467 RepID=A0A443SK37_9ACAR|nr:uncharacterized protein B4U80_05627 [Leptotrombidium deliense]